MSRLGRILLLSGACLALGFFLPGELERGSIEAVGRPNIIFILTDDLDAASVSKVPSLTEYMAEKGITFDNAFVTNSLCCPSRSTILTGQYPHNHLVRTNIPPRGGFKTFRKLGREIHAGHVARRRRLRDGPVRQVPQRLRQPWAQPHSGRVGPMVRDRRVHDAEPERAAGHVRGGHPPRRCALGSRPGLRETPGTKGSSFFLVSLRPRPPRARQTRPEA